MCSYHVSIGNIVREKLALIIRTNYASCKYVQVMRRYEWDITVARPSVNNNDILRVYSVI